jgi:Dehydrogenases with different specificities (related to short-chain alcohol dehydrogenases)
MNFRDKKAVILGGSSGIGFRVAEKILSDGGHVILGGRSLDKLQMAVEKLKNQLGVPHHRISIATVDTQDKDSILKFFAPLSNIDHLFTPGASYSLGPLLEISDEEAESPFRSKFWGQYYAVKAAALKFSPQASVVLMSGAASVRPLKGSSAYAACNAAIEGLGRAFALELHPVRVNVISPGTVDSDLWRNRPAELRQQAFSYFEKSNITGKVATVSEVAEAVCFLLLNGSMTGSTVYTDGGYSLR